ERLLDTQEVTDSSSVEPTTSFSDFEVKSLRQEDATNRATDPVLCVSDVRSAGRDTRVRSSHHKTGCPDLQRRLPLGEGAPRIGRERVSSPHPVLGVVELDPEGIRNPALPAFRSGLDAHRVRDIRYCRQDARRRYA